MHLDQDISWSGNSFAKSVGYNSKKRVLDKKEDKPSLGREFQVTQRKLLCNNWKYRIFFLLTLHPPCWKQFVLRKCKFAFFNMFQYVNKFMHSIIVIIGMLVAACDFSTLNVWTNIGINMFLKSKRCLYFTTDYLSKPKYI